MSVSVGPSLNSLTTVKLAPSIPLPGFVYATRQDGQMLQCAPDGTFSWIPPTTPGAPGDWQVFQRSGSAAIFQPARGTGPLAPTFAWLIVGQ